jgi:hypothetical protein
VLHSLAAVYAVPYESLMEKAGYLLPSGGKEGTDDADGWLPLRSTI